MSQEQINIKTPEYVSLQFKSAGLGSRSAAYLFDLLVLSVVNLIIVISTILVISGDFSQFILFGDVANTTLAIMIILLFIINWGYFFVLEFFFGGKTLGKRLIGIRVIQENGHSITLLSSFVRNFLRIVDFLPANYFVGMLMVFFHSKHKRLGDLVAGTIVVHERKSKKGKQTAIDKEISQRGLTKDYLRLEEWQIKAFKEKDWKLIKTYSNRFLQIPLIEKNSLTKQTAHITLQKIGMQMENKTETELENILFVLYLYLQEEWEYEL
ncbi:RDD family protein [Aquibacillus kalidii]|uniref:RDD family protein n=1 Tax=Aquibacillus kalidii TaxID=2762597 RepID=UPI001647A885|nr:RDD family protein [Aquibacillus kalidii]